MISGIALLHQADYDHLITSGVPTNNIHYETFGPARDQWSVFKVVGRLTFLRISVLVVVHTNG